MLSNVPHVLIKDEESEADNIGNLGEFLNPWSQVSS